MWVPTKYWLLWIIFLETAPARTSTKAASSNLSESSSQLPSDVELNESADDELRMRPWVPAPAPADDGPHMRPEEPKPSGSTDEASKKLRNDRGFGYYSKEVGKYMKLLSASLGTWLRSLKARPRESAAKGDDSISRSGEMEDALSAGSQSKLVVRESPVANSLLSKINKGLNYTSSISKYLSSMPAVRSLTSTFTGAVGSVQDYFKLIKPGTQWCGDGDRAKSFEDLGLFYKTDACCREHDRCPNFILSGTEKHGLRNDGVFTKLHCDCDVQFYQCLKSVHTPIALSTGFEYFNILKPPCFKKEHPVIGCNAYNRGKCVQYKLDSSHEKIWQWFENKEFLW